MLTAESKRYLLTPSTWLSGPVFEVSVKLFGRSLVNLTSDTAEQVLRLLGITGPLEYIESCGDSDAWHGDWRRIPVCRGIWELERSHLVGVKIIPSHRGDDVDFLLCVPPDHITKEFGKYPWDTASEAVPAGILSLHTSILTKLRQLHAKVGVKAVLLQDESWTYYLSPGESGLLMAKTVASQLRLTGDIRDDLVRLPIKLLE